MPYKFSGNLLVGHPRWREAAAFYAETMGLAVHEETDTETGFLSGGHYLYLAEAEGPGFVFEFYVPDLEEARRDLEAKGCHVVEWGGKGRPCYMRDPFGFVFNLWEETGDYD